MNIIRSFLLALLISQTYQGTNCINNTDDNINKLEDTTSQLPTTKSLHGILSTSEYPKTSTTSSTTTVTRNAGTKADCGSTVYIGRKHVMTCHINGSISNGIRWFRGTEEIITCYKEYFCKTLNKNRYQVYPEAHSVTKQAFIINDVSDEDTKHTWSCVDGGVSLIEHTELSSCNMKKAYDIAITADCGLEVQLGKSHVLRCKLPQYVSYSVTWFRDRESVLSCSSSSSCILAPDHKLLYTFSVSTNHTSISLVIISVSEDDMEKSWSCVAGSTYPAFVPESATCKLEDEFVTSVDCGQDVNVGKSHILTCKLPASITNAISWFRDQESIVSCSSVSNCVVATEKTQLYGIMTTNDKHSLIISSVSQEDLDKSWSCIVGTRHPENVRDSSTCTLHTDFGNWKITTIVIGSLLAISLISLTVLAIKVYRAQY